MQDVLKVTNYIKCYCGSFSNRNRNCGLQSTIEGTFLALMFNAGVLRACFSVTSQSASKFFIRKFVTKSEKIVYMSAPNKNFAFPKMTPSK